LGEGVFGFCKLPEQKAQEASVSYSKADVSALSAMLAAKWKSGAGSQTAAEAPKAGQIRSFKIASLDPGQKKIELELV
jgi:type II secretory pathway component PulM